MNSRDLLDARAWERRRRLAAFLTADPDRPLRPRARVLVAGVLLAAAYVGGWAAWPHLFP